MVKRTLFCVAVALMGGMGIAHAADLAPLYGQSDEDALPPTDYTFGTGWYLRGDLTATDDIRPDVLGTLGDTDRRDWNYGIGGGAGYKFNDYFRADLTGDYLGPQKTFDFLPNGDGGRSLKLNVYRFDALANGYLDLGTWYGLTPYVGAGVGVAGTHSDGFYAGEDSLCNKGRCQFSTHTHYDLAWAAMAGVTYSVSQNLLIDIGYRYLDLGTYEVPRFTVSPLDMGTKTDLTSHEIRAGLRYMIY